MVVTGPANAPHLVTQPVAEERVQMVQAVPSKLRTWLEKDVYAGDILSTFRVFGLLFCGWFVLCVAVGVEYDRRRQRMGQWGVHVRGTRMVSRSRFNSESPKPVGLTLRVGKRSWQKIHIAEQFLAYHFGIFGATGRGKSTLIREILHQVQARGETAVIYDPKGEFRDEFYDESRGDSIYDPTDSRGVYHAFESEAKDEAQATPWGSAFWPELPRSQPFFRNYAKGIFSFLMSRYPAPMSTLGYWLAHPEKEVAPKLKGTEFAVATDPKAPQQGAGIWATLGEVSKALRMMPATPEGRRQFSVREFAAKRTGWIFMTSDPLTAEALLPLQSAVIDLLILSTQAPPAPGVKLPKVWFVLDELASMQRLPQLQSGMTKQRASGNVLILGIHDMAQLKDRYGDNGAVTVTSQAATNIILQTESDKAAAEMAGLIGKEEIERMTESRPAHMMAKHNRSRSWSNQTPTIDPVMGSEVQGVPLFEGWLKQQGKTVKINIQPLPRKTRTCRMERLIPRLEEPEQTPAAEDVTPAPIPRKMPITIPTRDEEPEPLRLPKKTAKQAPNPNPLTEGI
jgi:hypothetical protein